MSSKRTMLPLSKRYVDLLFTSVLLLCVIFAVLKTAYAQQVVGQQNIAAGQEAGSLFTGVGTNPNYGGQ